MAGFKTCAAAIVFAAGCAVSLTACQTTKAVTEPADARLMKSSASNTAALSKAVSAALGGRKVTLAPDVLMKKSTLVMDPKFVGGRSLQKPDHFRLMTNGKSCYLVHEESGKSMPLKGMNCEAF